MGKVFCLENNNDWLIGEGDRNFRSIFQWKSLALFSASAKSVHREFLRLKAIIILTTTKKRCFTKR